MRPRPCIGITGFTARKQIDWLFDSLPKNFSRPVMVGVLVSGKTLHGQPNKWPERYPKAEVLKTLFPSNENALNLIHFNTKEPQNLFEDMCLAQDLAGPNCHGFQLNIAWPDRKVLEDYRNKAPFRQKTIVLQCGGKVLDAVARNPSMLAERVRVYEGLDRLRPHRSKWRHGSRFRRTVRTQMFRGTRC